MATGDNDAKFYGEEKEMLIQFCKTTLKKEHFDFFIFGHRHLPIEFQVSEKSKYVNTGDCIRYFSYSVFDGQKLDLKYFKE